jgi:hypothetical protein
VPLSTHPRVGPARATRCAPAGALALLSGLLACSSLSGDPIAPALRAETFCVERHERDKRDLASQIADSLDQAGLQAVAAEAGGCAHRARYRVTYVDSWNWDMRIYLKRLTLQVTDSTTGEIVALAESSQDSLSALGDSHRDIIDRTVSKLVETK